MGEGTVGPKIDRLDPSHVLTGEGRRLRISPRDEGLLRNSQHDFKPKKQQLKSFIFFIYSFIPFSLKIPPKLKNVYDFTKYTYPNTKNLFTNYFCKHAN